jgi:hypothetical protein
MSKQSCRYPTNWVPLRTRLKRSAPRLQIHSRCQRALAPPHAPRHRACHPPEESSTVTTCPMAQSMPPVRKGLQCHYVPRGTVHANHQERALVLPHARGTEPITRQERAPESPCASRLQTRPLRKKALASPHD